jgi:PAS domain S-box-containing protein
VAEMNIPTPISQREALRAEIVAKALEYLPVAVIVCDDKGVIYLVNRQAELMFGYDPSELIGFPVEILMTETLHELHAKHKAHHTEDSLSRAIGPGLRLNAKKKDGKVFLTEVMLGPILTTDGLYIVIGLVRHREDTSA